MARLLATLSIALALTGCGTRYVLDEYAQEATRGLLLFCIDSPVGEVGEDNLSLAQAYIDSTESLLVCQGVSRSIVGDMK